MVFVVFRSLEKLNCGDFEIISNIVVAGHIYEGRGPWNVIVLTPSVKELVSLSSNEAPGFDKVPARILKHAQPTSYDCCHQPPSYMFTCNYFFELNTYQKHGKLEKLSLYLARRILRNHLIIGQSPYCLFYPR